MAVVECVKTMILYMSILKELHLDQVQPSPIFNDNKSCITLGQAYSGVNKRVRYMMPRITWLMDQVKQQVCKLEWMYTGDLPPDIATKALETRDFVSKRDRSMGQGPREHVGTGDE